VSTFLKLDT